MRERDKQILKVRQMLSSLIKEETEFVVCIAVTSWKEYLETDDESKVKVRTGCIGMLPSSFAPRIALEVSNLSIKLMLGNLHKKGIQKEEYFGGGE